MQESKNIIPFQFHTYNPLVQPVLIACIIKNLSPNDLAKCLYINQIWNKEVKREFFIRKEKLQDIYWELDSELEEAVEEYAEYSWWSYSRYLRTLCKNKFFE
ncbi:hypothetical protein Glove_184g15 [Diversispora epigaea]|uniref:F-box domain-containing protein n=1 Tax=Diversispora epigaea TaxID=1348612 RepID=A0A397IMP5_9GLOM|nr:hypothetical protein Glove_184g15 [Diversispora epigaea]